MRKFKTLRGFCKYIAQANQQDKIYDTEHRFVSHVTDFSEQDQKDIEQVAAALEFTINKHKFATLNYAEFKQLLKELEEIAKYLSFGFEIQDEILKFLPQCNIL